MNSFASGFATSFFKGLAGGINQRTAEAKDYFNQQVEMARTTGVENRKRVNSAVDESVRIAKQLEAMGVPRDIIMAQANSNPAGLGDFYNQVEKLRLEANVPIDSNFFQSVYKLSGTFKAPNEDFQTFFTRIYDPIVSAATSDPAGFKQDPEGSIFASAFGLNAMEKAQRKLSTTEVAPGLTAEQAIAYGDNIVPNKPYGESQVVVDPEALKAATSRGSSLTPQVMEAVRKDFDDLQKTEKARIQTEKRFSLGEGEANAAENALLLENLSKEAAYQKLAESYAGDETYLSYARIRYGLDESGKVISAQQPVTEGAVTAPASSAPTESLGGPTEAPQPPSGSVTAQEATAPVAGPPASPLNNEEIGYAKILGAEIVKDNGDGTVTVKNASGETAIYSYAQVRDYINAAWYGEERK